MNIVVYTWSSVSSGFGWIPVFVDPDADPERRLRAVSPPLSGHRRWADRLTGEGGRKVGALAVGSRKKRKRAKEGAAVGCSACPPRNVGDVARTEVKVLNPYSQPEPL